MQRYTLNGGTWTRTRDEEALAVIELICQFANYTDEFVWWLRYAYVSPCVSAAFIDRKWIVESLHVCAKILVNRVRVYALYLLAMLRTCACTNAFACIDARSRVCASERNRAYVTAWLGAQIQRAQLAHRTSRRIVLILRLHSRGVEAASYRLEPTGRLCFKAEKRQGFVWILGGGGGMIGCDIEVALV